MQNKKVIAIFDGNHLAGRCFFALHLSDSKGRNVSAIYGCLESLTDFIRYWQPDGLVVCWDEGKSGHRTKVLPSYKYRRAPVTEEEIKSKQDWFTQMNVVKRLFFYLGIPQVSISGCEGDDICYVLSIIANHKNYQALVVSSDKDLLQLIRPTVSVYDPIKKQLIKEENFREIVGLDRKDFILYKALMGDSGDDVPGIKGIGPGRAMKLISRYKTIDELVNNTDSKEGKLVRGKREELERNLELVDISRAVTNEIYINAEKKIEEPIKLDIQKVIEVLEEYEFKSFLHDFALKEIEELYSNMLVKNKEFKGA